MCGAAPTVLDEFEQSETVIIAKIVSIDRVRALKPGDDDYDDTFESETPVSTCKAPEETEDGDDERYDPEGNPYNGVRSATMVVEKVYKGNVKAGQALIFGQGTGSDCISTYNEESVGDRRLLYLAPPRHFNEDDPKGPLRYYATYCGRSGGADAVDDLGYLNNIKKLKGRTRVSGTLSDYNENGPNLAGLKIKIIGKNKTYETKTDKNGFYEIYDLPAGDYLLEPQVQKGWTVDDSRLEDYLMAFGRMGLETKNRVPIELKENRHAGVDLQFTYDNSIRGKVLSPDGKPMKDVYVTASSSPEGGLSLGRSTNDRGEYELSKLSPGTYYIVANPNDKRSADHAFGRSFYPGTSDQKQAGIVSVGAGTFLNNITIQISEVDAVIEISGKFVFSDGKSIANQRMEYKPEQADRYWGVNFQTDASGHFSLRIPKGAAGAITGEIDITAAILEICPETQERLKTSRGSVVLNFKMEIPASENWRNVTIPLSAPSCPDPKEGPTPSDRPDSAS